MGPEQAKHSAQRHILDSVTRSKLFAAASGRCAGGASAPHQCSRVAYYPVAYIAHYRIEWGVAMSWLEEEDAQEQAAWEREHAEELERARPRVHQIDPILLKLLRDAEDYLCSRARYKLYTLAPPEEEQMLIGYKHKKAYLQKRWKLGASGLATVYQREYTFYYCYYAAGHRGIRERPNTEVLKAIVSVVGASPSNNRSWKRNAPFGELDMSEEAITGFLSEVIPR